LKKPLGRAAAVAEARRWLRELPRDKAEQLCAALSLGNLESTRGSVVPLKVNPGEIKLPKGDKPYAHPFHWAAFILWAVRIDQCGWVYALCSLANPAWTRNILCFVMAQVPYRKFN
jgi:hypothetical protein